MTDPVTIGQAPLIIGIVLFPGFTLLDLAGPHAALSLHGKTHLLWKTFDPVVSDSGVSINPTHRFEDPLPDLDVLLVPGGFGMTDAMKDDEIVAFVAAAGQRARYITSVCAGSHLLGMAGLLDGYRAATHWTSFPVLEAMGIEGGRERVVVDRNRISGGGVTAGIDFGLRLLAELQGEDTAKITQLMMEYDPQPPFDTGHPDKAGPALTATARAIIGDALIDNAVAAARGRREPAAA